MSEHTIKEVAMLALKALFLNNNEMMVALIMELRFVRPELELLIRGIAFDNSADATTLTMAQIVIILYDLAK